MYLLGQNEHIWGHWYKTLDTEHVDEVRQSDGSVLVAQSTETRNVSLIV